MGSAVTVPWQSSASAGPARQQLPKSRGTKVPVAAPPRSLPTGSGLLLSCRKEQEGVRPAQSPAVLPRALPPLPWARPGHNGTAWEAARLPWERHGPRDKAGRHR